MPTTSLLDQPLVALLHWHALDLDGCGLAALPPWIGQFPNLAALSLYRNQLADLPPSLWQLTGLRTLNLADNRLAALP